MTPELLSDLRPHRRCDAAAHVQLVVGVPDLRIFLDRLQELGAIHERILLGHGHTGELVTLALNDTGATVLPMAT